MRRPPKLHPCNTHTPRGQNTGQSQQFNSRLTRTYPYSHSKSASNSIAYAQNLKPKKPAVFTLIFPASLTLKSDQGNRNWYERVKRDVVYHHAKCKRWSFESGRENSAAVVATTGRSDLSLIRLVVWFFMGVKQQTRVRLFALFRNLGLSR